MGVGWTEQNVKKIKHKIKCINKYTNTKEKPKLIITHIIQTKNNKQNNNNKNVHWKTKINMKLVTRSIKKSN